MCFGCARDQMDSLAKRLAASKEISDTVEGSATKVSLNSNYLNLSYFKNSKYSSELS